MKYRFLSSVLAALTCSAAAFTVSAADFAYRISLNTTPLMSHPAGPFFVDFQLNDGGGVGNGNNSAVISHFTFGGGAPLGAPTYFDGAIGNLATTVVLTDTSPFNEFYQGFTAGTSLTFDLKLSTNLEAGGVPDAFVFSVLDKTLMNIPTLSFGSDAFVIVNLDSTPTVDTYASNSALAPSAGGPAISLAAPTFTAVPEPSTYGLFAMAALAGLAFWRRRQRR